MEHLIIAPILIPAFAGMLLLLEVRERQRRRLEHRGIGRHISMYLVHQGGSYAPVAPPDPPEKELFVGYDRHA